MGREILDEKINQRRFAEASFTESNQWILFAIRIVNESGARVAQLASA